MAEREEKIRKIKEAQQEITRAWIEALLPLVMEEAEVSDEDFTYWKTTVEIPCEGADDSVYLLSLLHVMGPKLKLSEDADKEDANG